MTDPRAHPKVPDLTTQILYFLQFPSAAADK